MKPETLIQNAILDLLQARKITAWRMNVGAMKYGERYVAFGVKGFADLLAIPTVSGMFKGFRCSWTEPWFLEVKTPTGRQSAEQKSFERQVKDAGAQYYIVRSTEEMEELLNKHGVR